MEIAKTFKRPLAVITGASSGIGYELAKQFAQHDFNLILVSGNPAVIETAQVCEKLGAKIAFFITDLSNPKSVDQFILKLNALETPIDTLVFNTDCEKGALTQLTSLHLAKHLTKDMIYRQNGRILLTSNQALIQSVALDLRKELKSEVIAVTSLVWDDATTPPRNYNSIMAQKAFEAVMAGEFIVNPFNPEEVRQKH